MKSVPARRTGRRKLAAILVAGAVAAGCAAGSFDPEVAPAASLPWDPPAGTLPAPPPAPEAPPELPAGIAPGGTVSLAQVVDVALANSPRTRATWLNARAAAAEVGSRRADLLPQVDLSAELGRVRSSAVGGQFTFQQTTWGPAVDLSWLLFDFGGQAAEVEEARGTLVAANLSHNAALQGAILDVEQAYFLYATARQAREAALADLEDARTNLEAAEARHDAGLATLADVLQARTAMSRAQLRLDRFEGEIRATRGGLATAMGLPADIPVEVAELPRDLPVDAAQAAVDEVLATAIGTRPDLLAARALAEAAEANVRAVRAEALPSLRVRAGGERVHYETIPGADPSDNWNAALTVRYPLFSGFRHAYDLEQARREAERATARAEEVERQVRLQVWTSYYALQTAGQRVRTSRDLLASAGQSVEVAAGRYKAGVGSILDLLAAQSALAEARLEDLSARADWLLSMAQLARDAGVLVPPSPANPQMPVPLPAADEDAPR